MLNTHTSINYNNEVTFSSVAGTLVKSCRESRFIRFNKASNMAKRFFDSGCPHRDVLGHMRVCVLQVMLCSDGDFLVEFIDIEEVS